MLKTQQATGSAYGQVCDCERKSWIFPWHESRKVNQFTVAVKEFLILTLMALSVAAGWFFVKYYLELSFTQAVTGCFLTALVISHVWFFAFGREIHDERLPKFIDYVYLFIGAVGLLLSVYDYEASIFQQDLRYKLAYWRLTVRFDALWAEAQVKERCSGPGDKDTKGALKLWGPCEEMERWLKEAAEVLPESTPLPESVKSYYLERDHWFHFRQDIGHTKYEASEVQIEGEILPLILKMSGKQIGGSFYPEDTFRPWKIFGLFLIASAAAMRISKVTVEIDFFRATR